MARILALTGVHKNSNMAQTVAYLGGALGDGPPFGLNTKIF